MNQKARHIDKRKAGSSARKLLRKLHTSEYANSCFTKKKLFFISKKIQLIQKSYNQQCHPLHLGREQYKQLPQKGGKEEKKISRKGKGKRRRESANKKEKKKKREGKGEGRGEREIREEERGKNGESGTKSFCFLSTPPPPNTFPSTAPSSDVAREQHNSHKGGTREKHNSYKQKTIGTKRQLTISKQTSCKDDQTLTLHHARIPITPKKGRRFEA